jgi:hypothetical protein
MNLRLMLASWSNRATAAEHALSVARTHTQQIERELANMARLISIERIDGNVTLTFARGNAITVIPMYGVNNGMMEQWRDALLTND